MSRAIQAGLAYFLAVFTIGFAMGVIRMMLVVPRVGVLAATLIEVPIVLALAWPVCGMLVRRFEVPDRMALRLAMGTTAFAMLMAAELLLGMMVFDQSPARHWASYRDLAARIGLAGQLLFAAFPVLRGERV